METTVRVTPDNQLPLSPQVRESLQAGDAYTVCVTEEAIVFKKVQPPLSWQELSQRIEELGPDPNQPTLQEIADLVKEVRQSKI